jgi:hypothetical protein
VAFPIAGCCGRRLSARRIHSVFLDRSRAKIVYKGHVLTGNGCMLEETPHRDGAGTNCRQSSVLKRDLPEIGFQGNISNQMAL